MVRGLPCPWCGEIGRESDRLRMRQGAREVLTVLFRSRPERMTFSQIQQQLPHVPADAIHCRLSKLSDRGDIQRSGVKFSFSYALPEGSTFRAT